MIEGGVVKHVKIYHDAGLNYVKGTTVASESFSEEQRAIFADTPEKWRVNIGDVTNLEKLLLQNGIPIEHGRQSNHMMLFLYNIFPTLLLIGVIYFIFVRQMRAASGGAMTFGKSRAKQLRRDTNKITFKEVAGIQEAKEEVEEIIEYLKSPQKFQRLGGKMPKGVLLCGSPGTGKTLLAKAIAGEADVPFFSISGSDFVEMFVGVGASRVRDMFDQAKKNAPCLLFIDEIDAVGRSRFTGIGGGHDEREQTLNALLVEMDGFEANEGVVVIAATNRPDVLDPALLRPGRFDRQVIIDLPSLEGRTEILKVHAAKIKISEGVDLSLTARGTPGFSGADLANLINEAALIAARLGKDAVDLDDLDEARDKVMWGKERRSRTLNDEEKKLTAYHEAGHAVLTVLSEHADPLHKVTIIPRGMSLGSTMFLPEKDRLSISRSYLLDQLVISMGGRVAEELFLPDICTGARQDLAQATKLAHSMVCDWGMSEALGPRTFGRNEELVFLGREVNRTQDYSESTARKIDEEVSRILTEAHEKAREILSAHKEAVVKLVDELLEKETVSGLVAEEIVKFGRVRTPEERGEVPPELPPELPPEATQETSSEEVSEQPLEQPQELPEEG
ncbi:MAG: ATP-dependent zinc metalloprotease FtsH [Lentisphaerae bacterium]|nr:ATP-dependent zinc metalloprotease FtsH [Lentisphaerota bacterium]